MIKNPGNPMANFVSENAIKLLVVVMVKLGKEDIELSLDDIEKVNRPKGINIIGKSINIGKPNEKIRLWLVDDEEAERLLEKERKKN